MWSHVQSVVTHGVLKTVRLTLFLLKRKKLINDLTRKRRTSDRYN